MAFRSPIMTLLLSFIATLASFYVADRLWQDAEIRVYLEKDLDRMVGQACLLELIPGVSFQITVEEDKNWIEIALGGGHVYLTWFLEFVPEQNMGIWMVIFSTLWLLMDVKQGQNKEGKTVHYLVFEYMDTDLKKYILSFCQTGGPVPPATVKCCLFEELNVPVL